MKLYAVKYAESMFGENHIFRGGSANVLLPIDFTLFLFEVQNRRILVDAGCDTMPGWDMKHFESPSVILERAGIPCSSITDVIITHSHHDHIEAVKYFKSAVIHIQGDEYELGKRYIPEGFTLDIFAEGCELCGGIRAVKIGGHSKGSCIVEFPMGEKTGVISGDEIYYKRLIEDALTDEALREQSDFLKKYTNEKYNVLVMHQPEFLKGTNGVVKIYEDND